MNTVKERGNKIMREEDNFFDSRAVENEKEKARDEHGRERRTRYSRPSMIWSTLLSLLALIMAFTTITEYKFFAPSLVFASTPCCCA